MLFSTSEPPMEHDSAGQGVEQSQNSPMVVGDVAYRWSQWVNSSCERKCDRGGRHAAILINGDGFARGWDAAATIRSKAVVEKYRASSRCISPRFPPRPDGRWPQRSRTDAASRHQRSKLRVSAGGAGTSSFRLPVVTTLSEVPELLGGTVRHDLDWREAGDFEPGPRQNASMVPEIASGGTERCDIRVESEPSASRRAAPAKKSCWAHRSDSMNRGQRRLARDRGTRRAGP